MRKIKARENIDIAEIGDCKVRLEALCDNLFFIRIGLRNEMGQPLPEVSDNAIYVIEEEIRRLANKIENLLYEIEEV